MWNVEYKVNSITVLVVFFTYNTFADRISTQISLVAHRVDFRFKEYSKITQFFLVFEIRELMNIHKKILTTLLSAFFLSEYF